MFEDIYLDYAELVMKAPVVTILVLDDLSTNDIRIVIQDQGSGTITHNIIFTNYALLTCLLNVVLTHLI